MAGMDFRGAQLAIADLSLDMVAGYEDEKSVEYVIHTPSTSFSQIIADHVLFFRASIQFTVITALALFPPPSTVRR